MNKENDQTGLLINKISNNDIRIEVNQKNPETLDKLISFLESINYKHIKNILLQLQKTKSPQLVHIRKGFAPMYCVEDLYTFTEE